MIFNLFLLLLQSFQVHKESQEFVRNRHTVYICASNPSTGTRSVDTNHPTKFIERNNKVDIIQWIYQSFYETT